MTWFDDFGAGTYQTQSGIDGVNIFYDKKFLSVVKNQLMLMSLGQRRPLPLGTGKTIQFHRWLNLAASVSNATLSEGVNPNATALKSQALQSGLAEYGAFAQISSLLKQGHIDRNVSKASELFGEHAATILDTLCHMKVGSNAAMPLRADQATANVFSGTVDSATSTTMTDAAIESNTNYGDANDDLNQSLLTITSGDAYGQQRAVPDYVASGGVMTVSPAWDVDPVAGDTYTVTSADDTGTSDKLSYANVKAAVTQLKKNRAPKFGKHYVGLIGMDMASDLMDDSDWKNIQTYKDQTKGIFEGEIGTFMGVRWVEETNQFQFPITTIGTAGTSYGPGANGANYSASGAVTSALVMGREAFGVTTFKNKNKNLKGPIIKVKTSGPHTTSDPLDRYSTVGWVLEFVACPLNPLFAQQIWCG